MRLPRISATELLRQSRAEAVVFDMDGVLADTEEFHLRAWEDLLVRHTGRPPDEEVVRSTFGQTSDTIIRRLWAAAATRTPENIAELSREKEALYREHARGRVRPLAGLEPFLSWLSASGVALGIGTSGSLENVTFLLDEFGWRNRFAATIHRSRFAAGKPAPDCFLQAAADLRKAPRRVLVFEDSVPGLRAARQGGFAVGAVATTSPEPELRRHARWVFRDFRDVAC